MTLYLHDSGLLRKSGTSSPFRLLNDTDGDCCCNRCGQCVSDMPNTLRVSYTATQVSDEGAGTYDVPFSFSNVEVTKDTYGDYYGDVTINGYTFSGAVHLMFCDYGWGGASAWDGDLYYVRMSAPGEIFGSTSFYRAHYGHVLISNTRDLTRCNTSGTAYTTDVPTTTNAAGTWGWTT